MKTKYRNLMLLMGVALLTFAVACGENSAADNAAEEMGEAADAVGKFTQEQWNKVVSATQDSLDGMRDGWDNLMARAEDAKEAGSEQVANLSDALKEKMSEAEQAFQDMQDATADERKAAKEKMDEIMQSLKDQYERLKDALDGDNG